MNEFSGFDSFDSTDMSSTAMDKQPSSETKINEDTRKPMPGPGYVWHPEHGEPLSGIHYRLLLHLLAKYAHQWYTHAPVTGEPYDFSSVCDELRYRWPYHTVPDEVLRSAANRFFKMSPTLRQAYVDLAKSELPYQNIRNTDDMPVQSLSRNGDEDFWYYLESSVMGSPVASQALTTDITMGFAPELFHTSLTILTTDHSDLANDASASHLTDVRTSSLQTEVADLPATTNAELSSRPTVPAAASSSEVPHSYLPTSLPPPPPPPSSQPNRPRRYESNISAADAPAFIAFFRTGDKIPDSIERYYWYCKDGCYTTGNAIGTDPTDGKPRIKGRFASKRTAVQHYQRRHGRRWRCDELPEPERETNSGWINKSQDGFKKA